MLALALTVGLFVATPAQAQVFGGGCYSDSDCASSETCDAGACVETSCDSADPYCDVSCSSDLDCAADELCELDICVSAPLTPEEEVAAACPCDDTWKNHGQYVVCVVRETVALALESDVADDIVSSAAQSECGR